MVKCKECGKGGVKVKTKSGMCSKCYSGSSISYAVRRTREKDKDVIAFKKRLLEVFG